MTESETTPLLASSADSSATVKLHGTVMNAGPAREPVDGEAYRIGEDDGLCLFYRTLAGI